MSLITKDNLFRNPGTHPITLDLYLLKKYGAEWLGWELETLHGILLADHPGGVSNAAWHQVNALRTLHLVDRFWLEWEVFNWCVVALNGDVPDFNVIQIPSVTQCMLAVDAADEVRRDVPWSVEVKAFLSVVHRHEEILVPQEPLDFVTLDLPGDLPVNIGEVKTKWDMVRNAKAPPKGESAEDIQLQRMWDCRQFLLAVRQELKLQKKFVT